MVSFQCDGCGDVVKKPKLNQHRGRCHSSFTCIDCSTTFQGTSYQSHNSCMTEAEKYQKHIYQNKDAPVKNGKGQKNTAKDNNNSKPVSIIDQLNEKKRKTEEKTEEPKAKKSKVELTSWSETELGKDETKNIELALKEVLKGRKPLCLKDARKKTIALIEKHPKYKKSKDSDLKKSFDKRFTLTLKDDTIQFA